MNRKRISMKEAGFTSEREHPVCKYMDNTLCTHPSAVNCYLYDDGEAEMEARDCALLNPSFKCPENLSLQKPTNLLHDGIVLGVIVLVVVMISVMLKG